MEIKQVTFAYDRKINRLHDIVADIPAGKTTTIIGPNGCGKSTLLGVMSRNYLPLQGEVVLDGKAIHQYTPKEFARKLAIVHQHNEAPSDLTVEKLVSYGRLPHRGWFTPDRDTEGAAIERALESTNLLSKRELAIDSLSGGERQRVWIAMALAQDTQVLFLDEPTTYLDMYYQIEILELVRRLTTEFGMTVVMVLHDINQAIRYSDHIIVMNGGRIVAQGTAPDVVTEEMLFSVYGVRVHLRSDAEAGLYVLPAGIG
ncbi:ABC transporter ATP-binding protein [Paenibacillus enshidis]|uniref:ABC transporter ATP-binding protein n=1 Tax=Paenibacillus enshidis TaxID=1458439 RepID=A0ABV5APP8_9BACL